MWANRLISAAVQIVTVRVLIDHFGQSGYAVYALFSSLLVWFGLLDFGLGFSLQNFVSEDLVTGEDSLAPYLVAARTFLLAAMALCLCVLPFVSLLCAPLLFRQFHLFGDRTAVLLLDVVGATFILFTGGGVGLKLFYAFNKSYLPSFVAMLSSLLSFGAILLLANAVISHKLFWTLFAAFLPSALLSGGVTIHLFWPYAAEWHQVKFALRRLIQRASWFWGFSVLSTVTLNSDMLVVSQVVPPQAMASYAILMRIFTVGMSLFSSFLQYSWPRFTEHYTLKNRSAIDRLLVKNIAIGISLSTTITLAILILSGQIVALLAPGRHLLLPFSTCLLFGIYFSVRARVDTHAIFLHSISKNAALTGFVFLQSIISVAAQVYLGKRIGIDGVILGLIISFLTTVFWAIPMLTGRTTRQLSYSEVSCV